MAIPLIGVAARAMLAGGGTQMAGQAVGQAAGMMAVGKVQQAVDAAMHPMAAMAGVINKVASAAFAAEAPFKALESAFRHVGSYVGKLSPIRMEFFEKAVADFQAAIGKILVPVLTVGTQVFRKLGDMVVTLMPIWGPQIEKVSKAIGGMITQLIDLYVAFMKTVGSGAGDSFVFLLTTVVDLFSQLAKVFQTLIENNPVSMFRRAMRGENMIAQPGNRTEGNSAKGLAYQQTTTETVSAMIGRIQQNAFGYSGGPMEQTADNTKGLLQYFKEDFSKDLASAIKEAQSSGPGRFVQSGVSGAARWIGGEQGAAAAQQGMNTFSNSPLEFLARLVVPHAPIV